tara:strand:- start:32922 stop:33380 length:459 start_codon:yes stop_codon:yes gene_type:complete
MVADKVEPYGHNFENNDPKAVIFSHLPVEFLHIFLVAKWIKDGPKAIIDNPTEFGNEFLFHIQSPLNSSMQRPQGPSCHSTSLPNPDGTGSLTPTISTGNVSLIIGLTLSTLLHISHAIISLIPSLMISISGSEKNPKLRPYGNRISTLFIF